MDVQPDALDACRSLGGLATVARLEAVGVSRWAARVAVRAGRLEPVRRGVVADPALPDAVRHALRHGGRLACHSLLVARGVWMLPDERLHVHLARGARPHAGDGCDPVLHRSDARGAGGPTATDVMSALAELARCLPTEHFVVALDSARNLGLLRDDQLVALRLAVPAAARRVVDESTALADSGLESLVRWRLLQRGVRAQPQALLGDGRKRDLKVGRRLFIETDGGSHDTAKQRREDLDRDAYAVGTGNLVLRFGYRQVLYQWREAERAIFAIIDRGAHLAAGA